MFNQQKSRISVARLVITDTGTHNAQFRRPYETHVTGEGISLLRERLEGSPHITPAQMSGITNNFLHPSAQPEQAVNISNGWNERRLRFMMEIVYRHPIGTEMREMLLGWSDHLGVSHAGSIDPNMPFVVNSVISVRVSNEQTPFGSQVYTNMADNSHILMDSGFDSVYASTQQRLRPTDIFTAMTRSHLPSNDLLDTRTMQNALPTKSNRKNNLASSYMATVLESYRVATQQIDNDDSSSKLFMTARGIAEESLINHDPFFSAMNQVSESPIGNSFTLAQLQQLDPNVMNVLVYAQPGPTEQVKLHQAGQTSDWSGATLETQIATMLSHSVPSLMTQCGLTTVAFEANNMDFGRTNVFIGALLSFTNTDLTPQGLQFKGMLETELLREISYNDQMSYRIMVKSDLLGETRITISLNGGAACDYVTPSFCDALLVPVITTNHERANTIASDFEALSTEVSARPQTYPFSKTAALANF